MTIASSDLRRFRLSALFDEALRRERHRRLRWAGAFLVGLLFIAALVSYLAPWRGGGGGSARHASQPASGAELPHAPGWYFGSAQIRVKSCPRCIRVDSWASTRPYLDAPNDFPDRTMASLGANGAIVWVTRSWQPNEPAWALKHHLLRIERSVIQPNFEGNPTNGRVSQWFITSWIGRSYIAVYVFFGTSHPSQAAIARVQTELSGTIFPAWKH